RKQAERQQGKNETGQRAHMTQPTSPGNGSWQHRNKHSMGQWHPRAFQSSSWIRVRRSSRLGTPAALLLAKIAATVENGEGKGSHQQRILFFRRVVLWMILAFTLSLVGNLSR
ncbi:unnamed protein product, partial [Ectocarpus sp. 12 AP-2014]